jgi:hypothetical protein
MFTEGFVVQLKRTESQNLYTALRDRESVDRHGAKPDILLAARYTCPGS